MVTAEIIETRIHEQIETIQLRVLPLTLSVICLLGWKTYPQGESQIVTPLSYLVTHFSQLLPESSQMVTENSQMVTQPFCKYMICKR